MCANGDEIRAKLRIIIIVQPDGTPVVEIGGFLVGRVHGKYNFINSWHGLGSPMPNGFGSHRSGQGQALPVRGCPLVPVARRAPIGHPA